MVAGSGAVAVAVVSVLALKDGLGGVSELEAITSSLLEVRLSKIMRRRRCATEPGEEGKPAQLSGHLKQPNKQY